MSLPPEILYDLPIYVFKRAFIGNLILDPGTRFSFFFLFLSFILSFIYLLIFHKSVKSLSPPKRFWNTQDTTHFTSKKTMSNHEMLLLNVKYYDKH